MSETSPIDLIVRPRGAIVVRDGRPFAATPGVRAISLPWPLPPTMAGALRTAAGDSLGFDWGRNDDPRGGPARARAIAVSGPLMLARHASEPGWTVYLPAPRDALITREESGPAVRTALRPEYDLPEGAGCDLPHQNLRPLRVEVRGKPVTGHGWWPLDALVDWLANPHPDDGPPPDRLLDAPPRESRMHVAIDRERETAVQGALFAVEGRHFADTPRGDRPARAMLCRVGSGAGGWVPSGMITAGGERRLADIEQADGLWPGVPPPLAAALDGTPRLRLALATPVAFAGGWRPGWLDDGTLEGSPPGLPDLRLRLVAAAVGRHEPISGWDLAKRQPKAARWLVPGGSVYFFEVAGGRLDADAASRLWLGSICDDDQDRRDGLGLALPGVWDA